MFNYFKEEKSLIGKKFGKLKVLSLAYENKEISYRKYNCLCECGNGIIVDEMALATGAIVDCGCKYRKEYILLRCNTCNEIIKIPFEKNKLNRKEEEFEDKDGNLHKEIFFKLDYTCNKCDRQLKDIRATEKDEKPRKIELFKKFIEENCIVKEKVLISERIKRSEFRKKYNDWIKLNKLDKYRLKTNQFNYVLNELYEEPYVKNNGIVYMSKIIFKK